MRLAAVTSGGAVVRRIRIPEVDTAATATGSASQRVRIGGLALTRPRPLRGLRPASPSGERQGDRLLSLWERFGIRPGGAECRGEQDPAVARLRTARPE